MRIFPVLLIFALAGCESKFFDDGIKKAVRAELKDPESAKFENALTFKDRACIEFNAKNSFGAYSGRSTAHLIRSGTDSWHVETLDGKSCTNSRLEEYQARDNANEKMEKEVLDLAKSKKIIPSNLRSRHDAKDACGELVNHTATSFRIASEKDKPEEKEIWMKHYREGIARITSGQCGDGKIPF